MLVLAPRNGHSHPAQGRGAETGHEWSTQGQRLREQEVPPWQEGETGSPPRLRLPSTDNKELIVNPIVVPVAVFPKTCTRIFTARQEKLQGILSNLCRQICGVTFSSTTGEPPLVGFPLALPMWWVSCPGVLRHGNAVAGTPPPRQCCGGHTSSTKSTGGPGCGAYIGRPWGPSNRSTDPRHPESSP
jgi:hypothetical protein